MRGIVSALPISRNCLQSQKLKCHVGLSRSDKFTKDGTGTSSLLDATGFTIQYTALSLPFYYIALASPFH